MKTQHNVPGTKQYTTDLFSVCRRTHTRMYIYAHTRKSVNKHSISNMARSALKTENHTLTARLNTIRSPWRLLTQQEWGDIRSSSRASKLHPASLS